MTGDVATLGTNNVKALSLHIAREVTSSSLIIYYGFELPVNRHTKWATMDVLPLFPSLANKLNCRLPIY